MAAATVQRRRRVRRSPWSGAERGMFLIAFLFLLCTGVSGIFTGIRTLHPGGEEPQGQTITTTTQAEASAQTEGESEQETEPESVQEPQAASLEQYADDEGYAGTLYQALDEHPEAAYVLRNMELYPDLYPEEILTFVTRFPEAMPFAAGYLDYTATGIKQEIDLSGEVEQGVIPELIQWDSRWGYYPYGEGMVGYSGCGPTCLSMVSIYLTGYHDNDPLSVANFAAENGYYTAGSGSAWTLMSQACINFGLTSKELPLDENKVIAAVEEGKPVILAMGKGIFTDNGHFIVVYGHTEEGLLIRDPNSPANSAAVWKWSEIENQIRNLWVFEPATPEETETGET